MPRLQKLRRKPISFNTTLRNPERIPEFLSVLLPYEGEIADKETILKIFADAIRFKLYEPTNITLGTYKAYHNGKFEFYADDIDEGAPERVKRYFECWKNTSKEDILSGAAIEQEKILYLLKNTITDHNEGAWGGGWASRFYTYYQFIIELGLVFIEPDKPIVISPLGHLMCKYYSNGHKIDTYIADVEQLVFLTVFARYQTNNPHRSNTIKVNFLPLVLNTLLYLKSEYKFDNGLSRSEIPFLICWGNNDYKTLSRYIKLFRDKFGYNVSDEIVYSYAMGLMEFEGEQFCEGSEHFIKNKSSDYKPEKLLKETPDEIIRKLRYSQILSLRGNGQFIDINTLEMKLIQYVVDKYNTNKDFKNSEDYFEYMGDTDTTILSLISDGSDKKNLDIKLKAIDDYSNQLDWTLLKKEVGFCISKRSISNHSVLKFVNRPVRLEFLISVALYKALPHIKLNPNYKIDDEGIPICTANGQNKKSIGADIDAYEDTLHVLIEPTIASSRSFLVEHEVSSISTHLLDSYEYDSKNTDFDSWFAVLITPDKVHPDVVNRIELVRSENHGDIFLFYATDFIDYIQTIKNLYQLATTRSYAKGRRMPRFNHGFEVYNQISEIGKVADKNIQN